MLNILKASAGSGKTYALAREYLRLVLRDGQPDAYRHVLAVTFTNKATDEMKRRILKELNILATDPGASAYLDYFIKGDPEKHIAPIAPDAVTLQKRARQQLSAILNDYTAFAVSTIDRFFQQTLRAFSREIGQFSTYQVQLDREALVNECVDRLLDSLTEEDDRKALLEWLTQSVQQDLQASGHVNLEKRLREVAGSLQEIPEDQKGFERSHLKELKQRCNEISQQFLERVSGAAKAALKVLEECHVDPSDSNRRFMTAFSKYVDPDHLVPMPSSSFMEKAPDPDLWFAKAKAKLKDQLGGALDGPMKDFLDCFGEPYRVYTTARAIHAQLYSLGVAAELRGALTQIQREKNILSIDDSNTLLRQIIDGTDTPFIYEKMGVRFEHFLLDEFQDTADIQWENFRPLMHESDDRGLDSLVVGDVKQSIYRFRGSDWDLLGSRLKEDFPEASEDVLGGNWRSCREIVTFNNEFFAYAAQELDLVTGTGGVIAGLYADVNQDVHFKEDIPGSVEVSFVEDQMSEILQTLETLHEERGARWGDIAILVRGNSEGSEIASALVERQIPVVSDDSLFVKSSVTVRRLVSQLSLLEAPEEDSNGVAGYLARALDIELPDRFHSLVDLAESLLRELTEAYPEVAAAEVPYIQSFMDYLQDWTQQNGNHLGAFLQHWADAKPKIASPQTGDSVRIMTIHKSKGLEFPFVIVPFAEKITLYKASSYWCTPASEGTDLASAAEGIYRVSLDGSVANSCFSEDYQRERERQAIDNLNILYVALTRPQYGLKIISAMPPAKVTGGARDWKDLSQVLYSFVKDTSFLKGTPFDFSRMERKASEVQMLEASYPSFPAEAGNRLRFSPEAADYFGPDGSFGPAASRRIRGNVLHGILARTVLPEDLPEAVEAAVRSGELPSADAPETLDFLRGRIERSEWFSPEDEHRLEMPIIGADGLEYRPDRVTLHPDGSVDIIDYKFGKPEEKYQRQVRQYMRLYQAMGHSHVRGFLWYLFTDEIIPIHL